MESPLPMYAILLLGAAVVRAERVITPVEERQITQSANGHVLTNTSVWSPDGKWIVYDLRESQAKFDGTRIEAVHVETGKVVTLYEAKNGASCGVATWHPKEPRAVFILGPENPSSEWSYAFSRRRGALADLRAPGKVQALDAMNYAPPFIPGALRGGSHVHVFSPDGKLVSFTYEDEILTQLGDEPGHEINQRNIGVAATGQPVTVNRNHARNNDGTSFSIVATRTSKNPLPGSDEISRACEEGWIGTDGYLRADGSRQKYALAFQGQVTARDGSRHLEVFVVDLPNDLRKAGSAPLEGTATTYPAPPVGTKQRRLTFTESRRSPGLQGPRHWLKSSSDGTRIAFLMKDDEGVVQLWTISPNGGDPKQLTNNPWDIASAFSWSPDGKWIASVIDGSVFVTDTKDGSSIRLTSKNDSREGPGPDACVFSPDGLRIAYTRRVRGFEQIFAINLPLQLLSP